MRPPPPGWTLIKRTQLHITHFGLRLFRALTSACRSGTSRGRARGKGRSRAIGEPLACARRTLAYSRPHAASSPSDVRTSLRKNCHAAFSLLCARICRLRVFSHKLRDGYQWSTCRNTRRTERYIEPHSRFFLPSQHILTDANRQI